MLIGPVIGSNESLNCLHSPANNFIKQDIDSIAETAVNILSLKFTQVTQTTSCFALVAQSPNFALQKLKIYHKNADGVLDNTSVREM